MIMQSVQQSTCYSRAVLVFWSKIAPIQSNKVDLSAGRHPGSANIPASKCEPTFDYRSHTEHCGKTRFDLQSEIRPNWQRHEVPSGHLHGSTRLTLRFSGERPQSGIAPTVDI
ncbi:hypothetical protein PM082_017809 [Marasmius tenuissimus]|nr:hypothetical protein PM082_017809 [Marasmius tenuissimus]